MYRKAEALMNSWWSVIMFTISMIHTHKISVTKGFDLYWCTWETT